MTTLRADLVVLGGGSGGIACALRAAANGASVVLVEPASFGGVCVHAGCVPKKATWFAAQLAADHALARGYGFTTPAPQLDWSQFRARRSAYSAASAASYARRLREAGVQHVAATGRFDAAGRVLAGEDTIEATERVVATGSRPRRAGFSGGELGIDSDGFFALRSLPRRVAIVGGGYVAVEFAGLLRALGSEVCLFARGDELLSHAMDAEVAAVLRTSMQAQGIGTAVCSEVVGAESERDGLTLHCRGGTRHAGFDEVLWAIGRVPHTHGLGLEALGVALDARARILVDARHATSIPHLHAIGDVTPDPAFTPYAIRAGRALADRLFGGQPDASFAPDCFATLAYSHPPIGAIGSSEREARDRYGDEVTVHVARFVPMRHRLAGIERETIMKLVCVGAEERIVGLHLCGESAEEMLQGFAVAVTMGATRADFHATLALHPTSAEELVLL